VTVLFADVGGFTPLSERFDPEIVHEMMDGCFALLAREVGRYGGRVNAFTGDVVRSRVGQEPPPPRVQDGDGEAGSAPV
jgi:class 3 adenylate cyclase